MEIIAIFVFAIFFLTIINTAYALSFDDIRNFFQGITGRQIALKCLDTDYGSTPSEYGICRIGAMQYPDSCLDANTLEEYYCGRPISNFFQEKCISEKYDCNKVCENLNDNVEGICRNDECVCIPVPPTIITTTTIPEKCTDSDGGINYYVKGKTKRDNIVGVDWCPYQGGLYMLLFEYYCDENDEVKSEGHTCKYGCEDGVCLGNGETFSCRDSDNGLDYYTKGTVSALGTDFVKEDFCDTTKENYLFEMYCGENNEFKWESYECFGGCENGACVETSECVDCAEKLNTPYLNPMKCYFRSFTTQSYKSIDVTCEEDQVIGMVTSIVCPDYRDNSFIVHSSNYGGSLPYSLGYTCIDFETGEMKAPTLIHAYCCEIYGGYKDIITGTKYSRSINENGEVIEE